MLTVDHRLSKNQAEITYLTETHKTEFLMTIGYGDRTKPESAVIHLFRQKFPDLPTILLSTVSTIEIQFRENGQLRKQEIIVSMQPGKGTK